MKDWSNLNMPEVQTKSKHGGRRAGGGRKRSSHRIGTDFARLDHDPTEQQPGRKLLVDNITDI